ncbi:MAG: hypothetical protein AB7P00_33850, partial [Sandaracinaceae bacterium]
MQSCLERCAVRRSVAVALALASALLGCDGPTVEGDGGRGDGGGPLSDGGDAGSAGTARWNASVEIRLVRSTSDVTVVAGVVSLGAGWPDAPGCSSSVIEGSCRRLDCGLPDPASEIDALDLMGSSATLAIPMRSEGVFADTLPDHLFATDETVAVVGSSGGTESFQLEATVPVGLGDLMAPASVSVTEVTHVSWTAPTGGDARLDLTNAARGTFVVCDVDGTSGAFDVPASVNAALGEGDVNVQLEAFALAEGPAGTDGAAKVRLSRL